MGFNGTLEEWNSQSYVGHPVLLNGDVYLVASGAYFEDSWRTVVVSICKRGATGFIRGSSRRVPINSLTLLTDHNGDSDLPHRILEFMEDEDAPPSEIAREEALRAGERYPEPPVEVPVENSVIRDVRPPLPVENRENAVHTPPPAPPPVVRAARSVTVGANGRIAEQVMKDSLELARIVLSVGSDWGKNGDEYAKAVTLASGICCLLGDKVTVASHSSERICINDLLKGHVYLSHGWDNGDFYWTFVRLSDADKMVIKTDGVESTVSVSDFGLASYNGESGGSFWHPTHWVSATAMYEGMGNDLYHHLTSGAVEAPDLSIPRGEHEFY